VVAYRSANMAMRIHRHDRSPTPKLRGSALAMWPREMESVPEQRKEADSEHQVGQQVSAAETRTHGAPRSGDRARQRLSRGGRDRRERLGQRLAGDAVAIGAEHVPTRRVGSRKRDEPPAAVTRQRRARARYPGSDDRGATIDRSLCGARAGRARRWFEGEAVPGKRERQLLVAAADHCAGVLRIACRNSN
jgi:hypothetical protein